MDWIGDMGGVPGIVMDLCGMAVGGWSAFHSTFATISMLYRVKHQKRVFKQVEDDEDEEGRLEMQILNLPL